MTSLRSGDRDLHHEDGSHRTTPATADGRMVANHERRILRHIEAHRLTDRVTVRIDNAYEDGHESSHEVVLPAPIGSLEGWWDEVVHDETGDGHGIDNDLGYCYTATVVAAPESFVHLIGQTEMWVGK